MLLGASFAVSPAASAEPLTGPPDAHDHWAHCNVGVSVAQRIANTTFDLFATCQFGSDQTPKIAPTSYVFKLYRADGTEIGSVNVSAAHNFSCSTTTMRCTVSRTNIAWGSGVSTETISTAPAGGLTACPTGHTNVGKGGSVTHLADTKCMGIYSMTTESSDQPSVPMDYFPGGSEPTQPLEGTCEVVAEQSDTITTRARFRVTIAGEPHASDEIEADHGDATAIENPTSGQSYWHTFAERNEPGTPYEVTYTISRDEQSDATCSVWVDFFDAELDSSEFGDGNPGDDDGDEDDDCGLNLICWLRWLFIPQGDAILEAWDSFHASVTDNYPFAIVAFAIDVFQDVGDGLADGDENELVPGRTTPTMVGGEVQACSGFTIPLQNELFPQGGAGNGTAITLFDDCESSPLAVARTWTYLLSTAFFVLAAVMYLWNSFVEHANGGGFGKGGAAA